MQDIQIINEIRLLLHVKYKQGKYANYIKVNDYYFKF